MNISHDSRLENEIGERDWRTTDCQSKCNRLYYTQLSNKLHKSRASAINMVMRKWFVLAVYQLWKSISAGPALKGGPEPLEKEIHEILGFET